MAKSTKNTVYKSSQEPEEICFVIMPFGGYFDTYYTGIFQPAITAAELLPKRGDDLFRPGIVINDVWMFTKKAKLILADLSTQNANVFYELGLAHAIKKPVILIAQAIEDVPFDLRNIRIIIYDKNIANWGMILRKKITKAIKETLVSPLSFVVQAFLSDDDIEKTKITITETDVLNMKKDIETLKANIFNNNSTAHRSSPNINTFISTRDEYYEEKHLVEILAQKFCMQNSVTLRNIKENSTYKDQLWSKITRTSTFQSANNDSKNVIFTHFYDMFGSDSKN